MSAESNEAKIAELTERLRVLCALAIRETDAEKQGEISAEIYRVVEEKQRIEKSDSSKDSQM